MDIILHIGAHRTATTTLQQFLLRNRTELREAGVAVWGPEQTRNGLFAGLIQGPQSVTPQEERRGARSCGVISIELARLRKSQCRQLIVSEENMIGSVRNNLHLSRLYPEISQRLLRFHRSFDGTVRRIGISVRSYETYWASCLSYGLGQGHPLPSGDVLDRLVTQPYRWRDVIVEVARLFPGVEIVVWPFERFAGRPEAQLAMLTDGVRIRVPLPGAREWINPSPRRDKLRMILSMRGEADLCAFVPEGDGRWMPFDADQQDALRTQYRADLAWLRGGADGMARMVDDQPPRATQWSEAQGPDRTRRTDKQGSGYEGLAHAVGRDRRDGGRFYGQQEIMV